MRDGRAITTCLMPEPIAKDEVKLYRTLHGAHCARRDEGHQCQGRVTIDQGGVTLSCPRCGDARKVYANVG